MNNNAIMQTVPAASALHKVPGFNPLKYLKRTTNSEGKQVLRLGLDYKKLWFRLACPTGRMLLNPLRITDQMALIEASVFFDRGDSTPASSFTATKTAKESRSYIRDAQNEVLNVALENAGFGIQLCDVAEVSGSQYGSDIPVPHAEAPVVQAAPPAQRNTALVETVKPASVPVQEQKQAKATVAVTEQPKQEAPVNETPVHQVPVQETKPVIQQEQPRQVPVQETQTDVQQEQPQKVPVQETQTIVQQEQPRQSPVQETLAAAQQEQFQQAPIQDTPADTSNAQAEITTAVTEEQTAPAPEQKITREAEMPAAENEPNPQPEAQKSNLIEVADILSQMAKQKAQASEAPAAAQEAPAAEPEAPAAPSYSADMPVEEICEKMTMEEALAVVVPSGACVGWTMAQVLEKRRASLKFYVYSQGKVDNVVKAAATLLWNDLELKKAG